MPLKAHASASTPPSGAAPVPQSSVKGGQGCVKRTTMNGNGFGGKAKGSHGNETSGDRGGEKQGKAPIKGREAAGKPPPAKKPALAIKGSSGGTEKADLQPKGEIKKRWLKKKHLKNKGLPKPGSEGGAAGVALPPEVVGADGSGKKRKADEMEGPGGRKATEGSAKKLVPKGSDTGVTQVLAMDCEMVGVGPDGTRSALARVCIVNNDGHPILDAYVKTKEKITDYRTWVSGIKPEHLQGPGVLTLEEAQEKVHKLLKGAILVGHSLNNDLKALLLDHPRKDTRDTGKYPPLMRSPAPGRKPRPRALRHLAREQLGLVIQEGEHSPVDDARAALYVYHLHRKEWERALATGTLRKLQAKGSETRKALRDSLGERAKTAAGARRARMGKGKGQVKLAADIAAKASGKIHPYQRDIKDDPMADL